MVDDLAKSALYSTTADDTGTIFPTAYLGALTPIRLHLTFIGATVLTFVQ
jgi:hypothetical protein